MHEDDRPWSKATQCAGDDACDGLATAGSEPSGGVDRPADSGIAKRVDDPQRPSADVPVRETEERLRSATGDAANRIFCFDHLISNLRVGEAIQVDVVHRVVADWITGTDQSRPARVVAGEVTRHKEGRRHP